MSIKNRIGHQSAKEQLDGFREEHKKQDGLVITNRAKNKAERMARNQRKANEKWRELKEKLRHSDPNAYANNDFAYLLMRILNGQIELALALQASLAARFPDAYPAGIIEAMMLPVRLGSWVAEKTLGSVKSQLWDYKRGLKDKLDGQIELSVNNDGELSAHFNIRGQRVTDDKFMERYQELVYAFLQKEGFDLEVDRRGPKNELLPPKVVYAPSHPDVVSGQVQANTVVQAQDFKSLISNNNERFRQFMKDLSMNDPDLKRSMGP